MKAKNIAIWTLAGMVAVLMCAYDAWGTETALTFDSCDHSYPKWSPDGNWIVYDKSCGSDPSQIYKVPSSGGPETALTSDSYFKGGSNWSPDGNWIVYIKRDATVYWQVYKVPSGGGGEVALTTSVTWVGDLKQYPEWSPDGNWIAFNNVDATNYRRIYKVSSSGGSETLMNTELQDYTEPYWTPDSQYIYFTRLDALSGFNHIYKVPVGGGAEIKITTENNGYANPQLSLDGSFFIFRRYVSSILQAFKVSSIGGISSQITNVPKSVYPPQISPNRQYVCYYRQQDASTYYNIYAARISDGSEVAVTSDSYNHFWPKWSPDGTKVTYHKMDATGYYQIYVADFIPPPPLIPTLSEWGMIVLFLMLLAALFLWLPGRLPIFQNSRLLR